MAVEIIAEVGECFNGEMENAFRMIREAALCGTNTVKFQILDMNEVSKDDPEYDWFAKISFSANQISELIDCSNDNGIQILFTPVSIRTAQMMVDAGCKRVKIASSFLNKTELLEYINNHFSDIIVSTGMASLEDIYNVVNYFGPNKKVSILHCVSEYPTGPLLDERGLKALDEKDVNMRMMEIIHTLFPENRFGYSDHTNDILAPIVAVSMGAEIIEKHITLDRNTPINNYNNGGQYLGTDHVLSIEMDKLAEMNALIRRTEQIRGQWKWDRSPGEKILMDFLKNRYKER